MQSPISHLPSHTSQKGMTLIETLVAITILTVAIVAPMSLTMQSLSAAYYARDQVVSSNLAQEAVESVRAVRDANILTLAFNAAATCPDDSLPMHLLCGIPIGEDFTIDARTNPPDIETCNGPCPLMMTDDNLYGHGSSGWAGTPHESPFRRTIHADYVSGGQDEIRITVSVERTNALRNPPVTVIQENLYRWVSDGSGE